MRASNSWINSLLTKILASLPNRRASSWFNFSEIIKLIHKLVSITVLAVYFLLYRSVLTSSTTLVISSKLGAEIESFLILLK